MIEYSILYQCTFREWILYQLNGPNCARIMSNKILRELLDYLPQELKKFPLTLMTFKQLSQACFGMHLDEHIGPDFRWNWERLHLKFISEFESLGIPMFPKFHILKNHVNRFIELKRKPLGYFSEVFARTYFRIYISNVNIPLSIISASFWRASQEV